MAEIIEIAKLELNMGSLLQETAELKKNIDTLKKSMAELSKSDEDTTAQQVLLTAKLKELNSEYSQNVKVLGQLDTANAKTVNSNDAISKSIEKENKSINELRANNAELVKLRNGLDISTQSGLIDQLNNKINSNNELIKQNADGLTKQKMNVGNYSASIIEAVGQLGLFGENGKKAFDLLKGGATGAVSGFKALSAGALSFSSIPLMSIISGLVTLFRLFTGSLKGSEEGMDNLQNALAPVNAIFRAIKETVTAMTERTLKNLASAINFIVSGFEKLMSVGTSLLRVIGVGGLADSFDQYTASARKATAETLAFQQAQQALVVVGRRNIVAIANLKKQIADLKLEGEDLSKPLNERIVKLNEALNLESQVTALQREELVLQQKINDDRIKREGKTSDLLKEQAEIQASLINISAEESNRKKEMFTKIQGMRKTEGDQIKANAEAEKKANAEALKGLAERMDKEEQLRILSLDRDAKSTDEQLQILINNQEKQKKILDFRLKKGLISIQDYNLEVQRMVNERIDLEKNAWIENATLASNIRQEEIKKQLEDDKYLSEEKYNNQISLNEKLLQEQMNFELEKRTKGIISEKEYLENIRLLTNTFNEETKVLDEEREANEKAERESKELLDFNLRIEKMKSEKQMEWEIEREILKNQYEEKKALLDEHLANQLISQEDYDLKINDLNQQTADAEEEIQRKKTEGILNLTQGLLGAISGLVDQNSRAGKAIAISMSGIDLLRGLMADMKLGFPLNVVAMAKDAIIGASTIKKIVSTKIPSASGKGAVSGGGSSAPVISVDSGGLQAVNSGTAVKDLVDTEVSHSLTVGVESAIEKGARKGTQSGMIDLSENRNIQFDSSF